MASFALSQRNSSKGILALRALLIASLVVTWGEFLASVFFPAAFTAFWRQPAAWVAARLSAEGKFDALYSDGKIFGAESVRLGANPDIFAANAPTTVLPYLPLAWLPVDAARTVWMLLSLVCFVASIGILIRVSRLPLEAGLLVLALAPLFEPWRRNIYIGAPYAVALLFATLGATLAYREASGTGGRLTGFLAGVAFALGCVVRQFYGLAMLLAPLARRQWRVVAWAVGLYLVAIGGTLAWMGPDVWVKSLQFSLSWREGPETALTAYQSLNNFLMHLFRYDPTLNPGPLVDAPWLVGPLWWVLSLGVLAVGALVIHNMGRTESISPSSCLLAYTVPVSIALLLSPVSEDYHYTLSLLPLILTGVVLSEQFGLKLAGTSRDRAIAFALWVLFALSVVLLGAPWRFYNVPGTEGWYMFLYYPRFYGNVVLLASGVILLQRRFALRQADRVESHPPQASLEPAVAGQLASKEQS